MVHSNHKHVNADLILAIQTLLQKKMVGTQEEIREALHNQGFAVNQAKISRVLHKLGAIKMNEGDRIVYRLPTELLSFSPKYYLQQLVLNISHNEALIVIHTAPGSAPCVARLLDQKSDIGILGTVAGDDTIFVAPKKIKQLTTVFQKIYKLLLS